MELHVVKGLGNRLLSDSALQNFETVLIA